MCNSLGSLRRVCANIFELQLYGVDLVGCLCAWFSCLES